MTLFNIDDTRRATGGGLGDVFTQHLSAVYVNLGMQLVREQAGYLSDDLDFNLAAVYHNLGEGYAKKGDYPDATRTFEEALALSPGKESSRLALSKVYFNRGRKLERRGLQGEANQAYRRSLELDPQRAKAQRALHLLGTRTGC